MGVRIKRANKNYIPDLVRKDNRRWFNPDRSAILVDDNFALMSKELFEQIENYPEKYHCDRWVGKVSRYEYADGWNLYWYGFHPNSDKVSLHFRKIILLD